jgi:hypothetical protein
MRKDFAEDVDIMRDIGEFVRFFRSLWGLLAGGSLFFPFINLFVDAIPYPHETIKKESAAFAMLGSAFIFLLVYMTKQLIAKMDDTNLLLPRWMRYRRLPLAGHRSTVLAIIAFIIFFIVFAGYLNAVWSSWYNPDIWDKEHFMSGVSLYGLIFMFATLAFSVLATADYMRQLSKLQESQREGWPHSATALSAIYERVPQTEKGTFSELTVIHEVRSKRDGTPTLEIVAKSVRGNEYTVTIDRSGNVLEFHQLVERSHNVKRVADNDLGNGVRMGGQYQNPRQNLELLSSDWARWKNAGWVKSGWFYNPPDSDLSHAVAFFKILLRDKGDGYVHVLSASSREHKIWLKTDAGSSEEHEFKYSDSLDALRAQWPFKWKS